MKRERLAEIARLAESLASDCPPNVLGDIRPWTNDLRGLLAVCLEGENAKGEVLDSVLVDQVGVFTAAIVSLRNMDRLGWTRDSLPTGANHLRTIAEALRASLR